MEVFYIYFPNHILNNNIVFIKMRHIYLLLPQFGKALNKREGYIPCCISIFTLLCKVESNIRYHTNVTFTLFWRYCLMLLDYSPLFCPSLFQEFFRPFNIWRRKVTQVSDRCHAAEDFSQPQIYKSFAPPICLFYYLLWEWSPTSP